MFSSGEAYLFWASFILGYHLGIEQLPQKTIKQFLSNKILSSWVFSFFSCYYDSWAKLQIRDKKRHRQQNKLWAKIIFCKVILVKINIPSARKVTKSWQCSSVWNARTKTLRNDTFLSHLIISAQVLHTRITWRKRRNYFHFKLYSYFPIALEGISNNVDFLSEHRGFILSMIERDNPYLLQRQS